MADIEIPEADALEQEVVEELDEIEEPDLGVETPEADAVEQAQAMAAPVHQRMPDTIPDGVPEADALEQAYDVVLDDDERS